MPKNVRNWWIECNIDGRKSQFSGGPRNGKDGFDMIIHQREDGEVVIGANITGRCIDGKLYLIVNGVHVCVTER